MADEEVPKETSTPVAPEEQSEEAPAENPPTSPPPSTSTEPSPESGPAPEAVQDPKQSSAEAKVPVWGEEFGTPDATNTEFVYYSSLVRELALKLTNEEDRQKFIPWIRRLFRPEYHAKKCRDKRNKYLLHLVIVLMNDEAWGIFRNPPPNIPLKNIERMSNKNTHFLPEWEQDMMWLEVLTTLPNEKKRMPCSVHTTPDACAADTISLEYECQLDDEFRFFLYLSRPFCLLLREPSERLRAVSWLQTLCTIRPDACTEMKKIRCDYIMLLYAYLHELRLAGPFSRSPWIPLPPLADVAKILADTYPVVDPCSTATEEFLALQPVPDEGAFCYLAISGELLDSTLNELD